MSTENERGFTLVEVMVVIVILGVLAGIVTFALTSSTSTATPEACRAEGQTFQTAVNAADANKPPVVLDGNDPVADAAALTTGGLLASANVKYLDDSQGGPAANGWTYAARKVTVTPACA
jgi:general secretion pathway protein G